MFMDTHEIKAGDSVYDISSKRGLGRVIRVGDGRIEVSFGAGSRITYSASLVQIGASHRTLYWSEPIIMAPPKNRAEWSGFESALSGFIKLVEEIS